MRNVLFGKLFVFLMLVASLFSFSCSSSKKCSLDSECKTGSYCSEDNKCVDFEVSKYTISFPGYSSGQVVTSSSDVDAKDSEIQIDIPVLVSAKDKAVLHDNTDIELVVKGSSTKTFAGKLINGKAVFKHITVSAGENTISAHLIQAPEISGTIKINVMKVEVNLKYYKNASKSEISDLNNAQISDVDDYDSKASGIQLFIVADSFGLKKGDKASLFIDEFDKNALASATVDSQNKLSFGSVTVPLWTKVTMKVVSGAYSKKVTFSVSSLHGCGFKLNIANNAVLGMKDDEDVSLKDLQKTLKISDITGCKKGTIVKIFVNDLINSVSEFSLGGTSAEQQITLTESKSLTDKSIIRVVLEDKANNLTGQEDVSGILVDLTPPTETVTFPTLSQKLTMANDLDSSTPGLQMKFKGAVSDNLSSKFSVEVKSGTTNMGSVADITNSFEIPYTFTQSNSSISVDVKAIDEAGNYTIVTVPFSVDVSSPVFFKTVCSKTGDSIINKMWLNSDDDTDKNTAGLQCKIIVKMLDGVDASKFSLSVNGTSLGLKDKDSNNEAQYDVSIPDTSSLIDIVVETAGTGVSTGISNTLQVKVDTIAPTSPVVTGKTPTNLDPVWNWTVPSDAVKLRHSFDESSWTETDISSTSFTTAKDSGVYSLYVQAQDEAGNWSQSGALAITVDKTPPAKPVISAVTPTADTTPTWSWVSGGGGNGIYRYNLGSDAKPETWPITTATFYTQPMDFNVPSEHTLYIQERDEAGNWSDTASFKIEIKNISDIYPAPTVLGSTPSNKLKWNWVSSGATNAKNHYRYQLDGTSDTEWTETDFVALTLDSSSIPDGPHTLYVQQQYDNGGTDVWSSAGFFTVVLDTTPPNAPIVFGSPVTNDKTPTWSWATGGNSGNGVFRIKLDNSDMTNGTTLTTDSSYTPTNDLSEGEHTLYVQERDAVGNWSVAGSFKIKIDLSIGNPPKVSAETPTNDTTPTFSWISGGGSKIYRYNIDSIDFSSSTETSATSYTPTSALTPGAHSFYIQEKYAGGVWSSTAAFTVVIDITAPNAPIVTGTSPTNNSTPKWTWISGGGRGAGIFRYKLPGIIDNFVETNRRVFVPSTSLTDGTYTLYVQERDEAGNWSASGSHEVKIDTAVANPPVVTGITPSNNQKPTWSWLSGGGTGTYRFALGNSDLDSASETTATSYTPENNLAEGSYTLYIQEKSASGLWSAKATYTITVDLTPPNFPEVTGKTPTNDKTPTWTWSSGGNGGAGIYRIKLDNSDFSSGATQLSVTTFTSSTILADGNHTLYVQEKDAAGNWSDTGMFVIDIDTVPPTAPTVSIDPTTNPTNVIPTWKWSSAGDGNGTFRYKLDDSAWTETTSLTFKPSALLDGTHVVYVQEKDEAGNWSTSGKASVKIDTTAPSAPVVGISGTTSTPTTDRTPTWVWKQGSIAGNGTFRYKLDDTDLTTGATETTTTSYTSASELTFGTHTLYVQERDELGNWSNSGSYSITIKEKAGFPTVSGTTPTRDTTPTWNWTVPASTTKFRYSFDESTWTETADATTTQFTPTTALSDGEHTLYVQAFDGTSWSESGSFKILINSEPPKKPVVSGVTPTKDSTPKWTWVSGGEGEGVYRYSFDENSWTETSSTEFSPANPLSDGEYTLYVQEKDEIGWSESGSFKVTIDTVAPTISWVSPTENASGNIVVTKIDDQYPSDDTKYAIKVKVTVAGAEKDQPITVSGFQTPPGYDVVSVETTDSRTYTLIVGLKQGIMISNPLTISIQDKAGNIASVSKTVIVNNETPLIKWTNPPSDTKILVGQTFVAHLNVYNVPAGTTIELVNDETSQVIGTAETVGSDTYWEGISITPNLPDSCIPYKLYARFTSDIDNKTYYTDSTDIFDDRTMRNFLIDRTAPKIDGVAIDGLSDTDRILNRNDNLNIDPNAGMQTNISVKVSDDNNSSDTQRTVSIVSDNGGAISSLSNVADTASFSKVSLNEGTHNLTITVEDCAGNSSNLTIPSFLVDTVAPTLTRTSPIGSSSNNKWIVVADDPALGTINADRKFENVKLVLNSTEEITNTISALHKIYDYSDTFLNDPGVSIPSSDISLDALDKTLTISLPELEYDKHNFEVTVYDKAGNKAVWSDTFEVDPIAPKVEIKDIAQGETYDVDESGNPGFQHTFNLNFTDIDSASTYTIRAIPINGNGGTVDSSRSEVTWNGTVSSNGTVSKMVTIDKDWWRITTEVVDNHGNKTTTSHYDIFIDSHIPTLTAKKAYNVASGLGETISGTTSDSPTWFVAKDINCSGDSCNTEIEVWTDAAVGTNVKLTLNGDDANAITVQTEDVGESENVAYFEGSNSFNLDATKTNTIKILVDGAQQSEKTFYINVDKTMPVLSLVKPVCSGSGLCRRKDLSDNSSTSEIELAELGYGFNDDVTAGSPLNFKPEDAIKFEVSGATAGTVTIETLSGVENGTATIEKNTTDGKYYASFDSLTLADTNANGQTDYDLKFKVVESPSNATRTYLVKVHVDLKKPSTVDISSGVTYFNSRGKVKISWNAVAGNNSSYSSTSGAVEKYEIKYQNYTASGACSVDTNFDSATTPLTTYAGNLPTPISSGTMNYSFFVTKLGACSNTSYTTKADCEANGATWKEADIHRNGDKYCFAIRAIDGVYATDGTLLVENIGDISKNDKADMKETSTTQILGIDTSANNTYLNNVGDVNLDGIDDYLIGDGNRNGYKGYVALVSGKDNTKIFERIGDGTYPGWGQGVSGKSDFDGDGKQDVAYYDYYGKIYIHYGTDTGIETSPSVTFTVKKSGDGDDGAEPDTYGGIYGNMTTADVNGDGLTDIIVSYPLYKYNGNSHAGALFVYYGNASKTYSSDSPDIQLFGTAENQKLGDSVTNVGYIKDGNVAGKRYESIVIGYGAGTTVSILYGNDYASGTIIDMTDTTKVKTGIQIGTRGSKRHASFGNLNGDGYDDLILVNSGTDSSTIKIFYGSVTGISAPNKTIAKSSILSSMQNVFDVAISPVCQDLDSTGKDEFTVTGLDKNIYSYTGDHLTNDPFIYYEKTFGTNKSSVLQLPYGIVYCDNSKDATIGGTCNLIRY